MIPWRLSEEKEIILFYADLLNDDETKRIINKDEISNKSEALHIAEFFWKMVEKSNEHQYQEDPAQCEYLLEKVINTLMTYFRNAGFEDEWEAFADI